ncbi:hypothetical protein [Oceaniglobus indicus]|uniref:hypothetical protein n=1 Tax=Oceaniglobus indicus TaxID=2047749 RepID=UPI0013041178|nr:hypothetical protein [Oceaniglobus indicus]
MNILKPAELKRPDLKRLTESLERHDVTKIEITKSGVLSTLKMTSNGWRVSQA